jgi:hypothetical protein
MCPSMKLLGDLTGHAVEDDDFEHVVKPPSGKNSEQRLLLAELVSLPLATEWLEEDKGVLYENFIDAMCCRLFVFMKRMGIFDRMHT